MLPGMASRTQPPAQQQAPAAVTLVVGEEEFLVDRAVRERIAAARAAAGDDGGDLHDVEASALEPGELTTLTSPSLFGGGAIVIVRNAQHAGKRSPPTSPSTQRARRPTRRWLSPTRAA